VRRAAQSVISLQFQQRRADPPVGFDVRTDARLDSRVTKGAVYHHFPDKHRLFAAVLDQYDEAAQEQVYAAIGEHPTDPWQAALAGLGATLDVCMDPVGARLIYIEGPVGLGWSRWRDSEEHYTRRNIRLLLQALIDGGIYRDDIPVEAMAQLVTGMITHTGIALAEASTRKRKQIRNELQTAIHQLMAFSRCEISCGSSRAIITIREPRSIAQPRAAPPIWRWAS
jgi:AcrR family transcriptional regulator